MSRLTKDQILNQEVAPNQLKEFDVPEFGGSVFLRPVMLEEQGKLADLQEKYKGALAVVRLKQAVLPLLEWAVCDADGAKMFTMDELVALTQKYPARTFLRLQKAIIDLSGLTEESRGELEKN